MTPPFHVEIHSWEACTAQATPVRYQVFVQEQHVPPELEIDGMDKECRHALALNATGEAVGTGRLLPDGHIGRMAVLPAYRGLGVGSAMLSALLAEARRLGYPAVVLSAQYHALAFYQRHGFETKGKPYQEAGIKHIEMHRQLP